MTQYYDRNSPVNLKRSISATERKLKELKLRSEISEIDKRLKLLKEIKWIYPKNEPHKAYDGGSHLL